MLSQMLFRKATFICVIKFLPRYVSKNLSHHIPYKMHYSFYLITKVPEFGSQPKSVLQPEDDPHGWCPREQKDWVITNCLQVGKKNNLGVLVEMEYQEMLFRLETERSA